MKPLNLWLPSLQTLLFARPSLAPSPTNVDRQTLHICPGCLGGLPAGHRVYSARHTINGKPVCLACVGRIAIADSRAEATRQGRPLQVYGPAFENEHDRLTRLVAKDTP